MLKIVTGVRSEHNGVGVNLFVQMPLKVNILPFISRLTLIKGKLGIIKVTLR